MPPHLDARVEVVRAGLVSDGAVRTPERRAAPRAAPDRIGDAIARGLGDPGEDPCTED